MNILVVGVGYVGTTTALLFAELGWNVVGVDSNERKIQDLENGVLPFYEPGLDTLLKKHIESGKLSFSTNLSEAVKHHDVIFICVGTPSMEDGGADLQYVRQAATTIGASMDDYKLLVTKSTVPVGTQRQVVQWISEAQSQSIPFDVVSNPEFLREGSAMHDAFHPDRIIIGSDTEAGAEQLKRLYRDLECPYLVTSPATAEMIKYASNSFLAVKISFMNELARLCDQLDVSISDVAEGMGYDTRIGRSFLRAGIGFGGSCFPKDVKSLLHTSKMLGEPLRLLQDVVAINETQYIYVLERMRKRLGSFQGKQIAVLGLSFKPGTDDMREAPSLSIISYLVEHGAIVQVHDPVVRMPAPLLTDNLAQFADLQDTLSGADAAIICTEWPEYADADWASLKKAMKQPLLVDGRNMLNRERLQAVGFTYVGIGNG
ncbi:UDP-glucose dehydrogenase family protein [Paenibacillus marinisediminis]